LVPETISTLIETNIRVWVLTGDKQETAIEIGKSCQLIQTDMRQIILSSDTRDAFETKLNEELKQLEIDITKTPIELNKILKAR
jgi:phospholipid-transporting ATPase